MDSLSSPLTSISFLTNNVTLKFNNNQSINLRIQISTNISLSV